MSTTKLPNVAQSSLLSYDETAGVLVDTNVWVDCIDESSPWHDWAVEKLQVCSERSPLHVNVIIYSELLIPQPNVQALNAMLDVYETLRTLKLDTAACTPIKKSGSGFCFAPPRCR